jgi:hypothetical protein
LIPVYAEILHREINFHSVFCGFGLLLGGIEDSRQLQQHCLSLLLLHLNFWIFSITQKELFVCESCVVVGCCFLFGVVSDCRLVCMIFCKKKELDRKKD